MPEEKRPQKGREAPNRAFYAIDCIRQKIFYTTTRKEGTIYGYPNSPQTHGANQKFICRRKIQEMPGVPKSIEPPKGKSKGSAKE